MTHIHFILKPKEIQNLIDQSEDIVEEEAKVEGEEEKDITKEDDDIIGADGNEPLTLQLLKADEEAGLTLDDEIYQIVQADIESDPLMGVPDDLSLYPFDVVEYEDGNMGLLFIMINRLDNPIQNLMFNFTFGNDEGDYIFDGHLVDLPEDYLGVLEEDGAVPIILDIEPEDEELFNSLTLDNVFMDLDDIGIDFVE